MSTVWLSSFERGKEIVKNYFLLVAEISGKKQFRD